VAARRTPRSNASPYCRSPNVVGKPIQSACVLVHLTIPYRADVHTYRDQTLAALPSKNLPFQGFTRIGVMARCARLGNLLQGHLDPGRE